MGLQLSPTGVGLIQLFEHCRLESYQDQHGIWTIGWGHTGPEVVEGLVWTGQQCDDAFRADVKAAVAANDHVLPETVTQNQFDALVSFTFNVGIGAEAHSTMLKLILAGDMQGAAEEFPKWDHVNGKPNDGLLHRRLAEQALFLS